MLAPRFVPKAIKSIILGLLMAGSGGGGLRSNAGQVDYGNIIDETAGPNGWTEVEYKTPFPETAPVVIANPVSASAESVVVEIRNTSLTGFEYRLLIAGNPQAAGEKASIGYVAAEPGEYNFGGIEWKVGVANISETNSAHLFTNSFSGDSIALIRPLDVSLGQVRLAMANSASLSFGFEFESGPVPPSVAVEYICVEVGSGIIGKRSFLACAEQLNALGDVVVEFGQSVCQPVIISGLQSQVELPFLSSATLEADPLGGTIRVATADGTQVTQIEETLGLVALGLGVQDGTVEDSKLEVGELHLNQAALDAWYHVEFSAPLEDPAKKYVDPVVIVSPLTNNDPAEAQVRIRNLTATGCDFQVIEPLSSDGLHAIEKCHWLVMESGQFTIGGVSWYAGKRTVGRLARTHRFPGEFEGKPVLLPQLVSDRNSNGASTRLLAIGESGFQINLVSDEFSEEPAAEQVAFIAIETGRGEFGSATSLKFEAKTREFANSRSTSWEALSFEETFAAPFFFGAIQDGPSSASSCSRVQNLTERSVRMRIPRASNEMQGRSSGYLVFGDMVDEDSDDIPDVWEQKYNLNSGNPADASQHNDDDELTNLQEYLAGTNPLIDDSDGDGLVDDVEVNSDLGFDPNKIDSDGDGLGDSAEYQIIVFNSRDSVSSQAWVLPGDDFDGDGIANLAEEVGLSDPVDWYNGVPPVLAAVRPEDHGDYPEFGDGWLRRPMVLLVKDQLGSPLSAAPVRFVVSAGGGRVGSKNAKSGVDPALRDLTLRSDNQGRIEFEWKLGSGVNLVNTVHAFTAVGGQVQLQSYLAYTGNAVPTEFTDATGFWSPFRNVQRSATGQIEWSSTDALGEVNNSLSGSQNQPVFHVPDESSHLPWFAFDGSQALMSFYGRIGTANASFVMVIAPEAANSHMAAVNPSATDSKNYSYHGLSLVPSDGEDTSGLAESQVYPSGTQKYLLSGNIPSGSLNPHRYTESAAVAKSPPEFKYGSRYIHKDFNSQGEYNVYNLQTKARENWDLHRRYDATNVTGNKRKNDPANVIRAFNKPLGGNGGILDLFEAWLTPEAGHHWQYDSDFTLGYANFNPGSGIKFSENLFRYRKYRNAGYYWTFSPGNIGTVSPALSVGFDGAGYFEVQSKYAPLLGSVASPAELQSGSPCLVTFETKGGQRSIRWNGKLETLSFSRSGGWCNDWSKIGTGPDGLQGYVGKLGAIMVFEGTIGEQKRVWAEDSLAALYRLPAPDRNGDEIPDWWTSMILGSSSPDSDGLTTVQEYAMGTHPAIASSDGDTIPDNLENSGVTNPLRPDSDFDGIPDGVDPDPGDPSNGETIGEDGRSAGLEYVLSHYSAVIPGLDSDGDGIDDQTENYYTFLDPNNPDDAFFDEDGDGVSNFGEFYPGWGDESRQIVNPSELQISVGVVGDQAVEFGLPVANVQNAEVIIEKSNDGGSSWSFAGRSSYSGSSYHVAGLDQKTTYLFRVRYVRPNATWVSDPVEVQTNATIPDEPASFQLTSANPSAALFSWKDTTPFETSFVIERRLLPNGGWGFPVSFAADSIYGEVFGLDGNKSYEFRLIAANGDVKTIASASLVVPRLPEPVTEVQGEWRRPGEVYLSWNSPEDPTRTGIRWRRSVAGSEGALEIGVLAPESVDFLDESIEDGNEYCYVISTLNVRGEAAGGALFVTAEATFGVPPSNLIADPVGPRSINLSWVDETADESGFTIERANVESPQSWKVCGTVEPDSFYFEDRTDLQGGHGYLYRVIATRDAEEAASDIVEVHTPDFPEPNLPPASLALLSEELGAVMTSGATFEAIVDLPDEGERTDARIDGEFAKTTDGTFWFQRYVSSAPGSLPGDSIDYYQIGNGTSSFVGTLVPPNNAGPNPDFGACVVAFRGLLVVGAPGAVNLEGVACGLVYVYDLLGPTPYIPTALSPSSGEPGDRFGASVSIHGSRMIVGSPGREKVDGATVTIDAGSVHLFEITEQGWALSREEWSEFPQEGAQFGFATAVAGDNYLVGAPFADNILEGQPGNYHVIADSGQIQLARWDGVGKVTLGNLFVLFESVRDELHGLQNSHFGFSVALDDRLHVAVGMPDSSWISGDDLFDRNSGNAILAQWNGDFGNSLTFDPRWISPESVPADSRFASHLEGADWYDFGIGTDQIDSLNRHAAYFASLVSVASPGVMFQGDELPYPVGVFIAEQGDEGTLTFDLPLDNNPIGPLFSLGPDDRLMAGANLESLPEGFYRLRASATDDRGGSMTRTFPIYLVNSNLIDGDGDGIADGWEITHELDPNSLSDGGIDSDGDGLSAKQEYDAALAGRLSGADSRRWDLVPGGDFDGDGVINSEDAAPVNPNVGRLNLDIINPQESNSP